MSRQAITANRLTDGRVVYLDPTGAWVTDIARARAIDAADEATWLARARADESACLVVAPYAIALTDTPARSPATLREVIRSRGPTVETEATSDRKGFHHNAHV